MNLARRLVAGGVVVCLTGAGGVRTAEHPVILRNTGPLPSWWWTESHFSFSAANCLTRVRRALSTLADLAESGGCAFECVGRGCGVGNRRTAGRKVRLHGGGWPDFGRARARFAVGISLVRKLEEYIFELRAGVVKRDTKRFPRVQLREGAQQSDCRHSANRIEKRTQPRLLR